MRIKITPPAGQTPEQVQQHLEQWRQRTDDAIDAMTGPEGDRLRASREKARKIVARLNPKIVITKGH